MALSPKDSEALCDQVEALRTPETDADEALANKLARLIYRMRGYEVKVGYDFSGATHPQETQAFDEAVVAINYLREQGLPH